MPKISIIVPVYNAEKYLHQCVDSILAQTYTDFEVLLIDDGSKDKSGEICDAYAVQDSRVRVFHNPNMGSAAARQFGFEHAKGMYIAAVDADDWVDADYLKDMVKLIEKENADMVMCAYWIDDDVYMANKPTQNETRSWCLDMLLGNCHAGLWNKLLKRELLLSENALVPSYNYYEDMVVTLSYLHRSSRVVYRPNATYHYRQNPVSLTNDKNLSKRIRMYEECMMNLKAVAEEYRYMSDPDLVEALYCRANYEKGRLLTFLKQYFTIRPYLLKYFTESPSIIPVTNLRTWGVKNAIQGHLLPYLFFKMVNWTKNHIKKYLCKNS